MRGSCRGTLWTAFRSSGLWIACALYLATAIGGASAMGGPGVLGWTPEMGAERAVVLAQSKKKEPSKEKQCSITCEKQCMGKGPVCPQRCMSQCQAR